MHRLMFLRYVSMIAAVSTFMGSVLMFIVGAFKTVKAFTIYFIETDVGSKFEHISKPDVAMISLIESVDSFLFALVLLIFSFGIVQIFIMQYDTPSPSSQAWWNISNISDLKNMLAEVIIVILFVFFLKIALVDLDKEAYKILILPASIFFLSISLFFLKKTHK